MKKILFSGIVLIALNAEAQKTQAKTTTKTPVKTTAKTVVTPKPVKPLKNKLDSVSYAIGFMVANFYKNQQGIEKLNPDALALAVQDIYGNKTTILNEDQSNNTLMRFLNPALDQTLAEGEAFLTENKKRPEVKTTASGLQYEVLVEGTGKKPSARDTVVAHYAGKLINGKQFDNSYDRGQPLTINAGAVIKGWTEGLQLMSEGSKYKFYIPHNLGYGLNDQGHAIPGGSVLVFEVELLEVR